jgi:hypothetical protein
MNSTEYNIAVAETLDVLSHTNPEYVQKIPDEVINFLQKNAQEDYKTELNYEDGIENLKLKQKTREILAFIYRNYLCDTREKMKYDKKLMENEKSYQNEIKKIYNDEDLFKNKKNKDNNSEEKKIIEIKNESIIQKIISKIKRIFSK